MMGRRKKETAPLPPAETTRLSWRALHAARPGGKVRVRLLQAVTLRGAEFPSGLEVEISPREAAPLVARGEVQLLEIVGRR